MSILSKSLQQAGIKTPSRTANSWNIATSSFDGSNTYSYSTRFNNSGDFSINSSGNLAFGVGSGVSTYGMDSAFDIANIYFKTSSYPGVYSYNDTPYAVAVSPSGSRALIANGSNTILQYDLAAPWNMASANLTPGVNYFSIPNSFNNITSHFFKPDGLSLYILENNTTTIRQYSLSSAYDLSTCSYVRSFTSSVGITSFYIRDDGSQLYILSGGSSKTIYQYSMSTPWNISTSTSLYTFLYIGAQSPTPYSMYFSPDGLNLYVFGSNDWLAHYRLFIAWDNTSAVYQAATSKSLTAYTIFGYTISFSADGYKLFLTTDRSLMYQFTMSTAWHPSTISLNTTFDLNKGLSVGATHTTISSDGYIIIATAERRLTKSTMSTSLDLSTASSPTSDVGILRTPYTTTRSIEVDSSGSKLYAIGTQNGTRIIEYTMSNTFSLSGISYVSNLGVITSSAIALSNDGRDIYIGSADANPNIYRYRMSTPLTLSTATLINTVSVSSSAAGVAGLHVNPSNNNIYVSSSDKAIMFDYQLVASPTTTSVSITLTKTGQVYLSRLNTSTAYYAEGLVFNPDGTRLFIGNRNGIVYEYRMTIPWDISTMTWYTTVSGLAYNTGDTRQFYISRDGKYLYSAEDGTFTNRITVSTLSTPWSIAGASYANSTVTSFDSGAIVFKPDGTKFYVVIPAGIQEYTTASFNVSAAALSNTYGGSFGSSLYISPSGTNIYTAVGYNILKIPMTTNWNLSSALSSTILTQTQTYDPAGLSFSPDGNNMYILDNNRLTLLSYSIG